MDLRELSTDKCDHSTIDFNFRSLRILVFKNGEEYDPGNPVVVSRHHFRHWIRFLDYLTKRLGMMGAVHKLYTTNGVEVYKVWSYKLPAVNFRQNSVNTVEFLNYMSVLQQLNLNF